MMASSLCFSIRFLNGSFHGQHGGNESEWPPSPLRFFQSLVAAAANRWTDPRFPDHVVAAFSWMESLPPPVIFAPSQRESSPYCLSVPNNAMDLVGKAWTRGVYDGTGDSNPATHKTLKGVRSNLVLDDGAVHYAWSVPDKPSDEVLGFLETLHAAARSITHLGWGIDQVVVHSRVLQQTKLAEIRGERWLPTPGIGRVLRCPVGGTLADLREKHQAFLQRVSLESQTFYPMPPLSRFAVRSYRCDTDPLPRPFAGFALLKLDASRYLPYSPIRRTHVVAAMMRHATAEAARCAERPEEWINTFVQGHGEGPDGQAIGKGGAQRFSYIPIPTIEERKKGANARHNVVGAIRRVLVVEPPGLTDKWTGWCHRVLSGRELTPLEGDTKTSGALLSSIPDNDGRLRHYTTKGTTWATVTPVVLPGHDDRKLRKAEKLVRKAIRQAGYSEALAENASIECRRVGFWSGLELSTRYIVPQHLRHLPRYHVRIQWGDKDGQPISISGPLCLGAGRFIGFGLFAKESESTT